MDRIINKKIKLSASDVKRVALHAPSEGNLLSATKRKLLRQQCNSRSNWSDGGNWIGSGKAPSCSGSQLKGSSTITYTFPTDIAAFTWNAEWEKAIRHTGHLATAVVTVSVSLLTAGLTSALTVGAIAAISKDELQALVSYPKVARGWTYLFTVTHIYNWSPHPYGKSGYIQEFTGLTFDTNQSLQTKSVTRVEIDFDSFPESAAIKLASDPGKNYHVVYKG